MLFGRRYPLTLGICSQGLKIGNPDQPAPVVDYALTYTRGEGLAFQKLDDTVAGADAGGAAMMTRETVPGLQQALDDTYIVLGENDDAGAALNVGGQGSESMPEMDLVRLQDRIDSETEPIPIPVVRVADAYLAPDQIEVRLPGKPGLLLKEFDVTTENDVEIGRSQIDSEVLQQPAPEVIGYGIRTDAAERGIPRQQ